MKKCQGQQVAKVVGHMRYKHPAKRPDGTLLTYNLSDLRYDLKYAYLKVTGRKRATKAPPAPRKPPSPAAPVAPVPPEGRAAQGRRQKMQKTSEKTVKDKGQERQARRPKPSVIEEEKDLLASDAEIEVEEPVRSRPSRKRSTAPEPSIPSTTSDRPPAPEEWPWA